MYLFVIIVGKDNFPRITEKRYTAYLPANGIYSETDEGHHPQKGKA